MERIDRRIINKKKRIGLSHFARWLQARQKPKPTNLLYLYFPSLFSPLGLYLYFIFFYLLKCIIWVATYRLMRPEPIGTKRIVYRWQPWFSLCWWRRWPFYAGEKSREFSTRTESLLVFCCEGVVWTCFGWELSSDWWAARIGERLLLTCFFLNPRSFAERKKMGKGGTSCAAVSLEFRRSDGRCPAKRRDPSPDLIEEETFRFLLL